MIGNSRQSEPLGSTPRLGVYIVCDAKLKWHGEQAATASHRIYQGAAVTYDDQTESP